MKLLGLICIISCHLLVSVAACADVSVDDHQIRLAVERSLSLLERTSATSADMRICFTCHGQAQPVFAMVEATRHGFHSNAENIKRQVAHTYAHLQRGQRQYANGDGQGGQVDTAGYALWTLEDGGREPDEVTDAVVGYLLKKQNDVGSWPVSSNRPPSEASSFTATYLALRGLSAFGEDSQANRIQAATSRAALWLLNTVPKETEDSVFRLLSFDYVAVESDVRDSAIADLIRQQRDDGGWSQLASSNSDAYATATVLYALHRSGVKTSEKSWRRGLQFLIDAQLPDGSWLVASRSKPFQTYFESGFPHGTNQFISTTATAWATIVLLFALPEQAPSAIETLDGTEPLELPESDLSGRVMAGAHHFAEAQIDKANRNRESLSWEAAEATARRAELRVILGVVNDRLPARLERYGDDDNPALVAETEQFAVFQVRWPVFDNVMGEGLLVRQKNNVTGSCVVIPDADQTPEQLLGLADGLEPDRRIAYKLAQRGMDLLIPTIVSRAKLDTEDDRLKRADITHREWIYRQAFHMGRHVIGYEIQRVLGAIDWFESQATSNQKIGVVGYGEGGLIAMHAAAVDERIAATLVSGYFDSSQECWNEPIYRNVWRRAREHGNAQVASLILPRALVIEHSPFPNVHGHKGELKTPVINRVKAEFDRIHNPTDTSTLKLITAIDDQTTGPFSDAAVEAFTAELGGTKSDTQTDGKFVDNRSDPAKEIQQRQRRCVEQLEQHVQSLVQKSEYVRDQFYMYAVMPEWATGRWSTERRHATDDPQKFIEASKGFREKFATEAMGRFDAQLLPTNPRTRKIIDNEKWTAYDVLLDVYDGFFAWGTVVVPKGIQPGERRPVVVCQHGRDGVPRDTIDAGKTAYNDFAAKLAERGFITLAPHNLYRGEDEYRWLDRKANAVGCSLFSFIIASHHQTLRWLDSLDFVDGDRIAFYGLSYGGETAVRVPTVLEKYCLSICSGDFNQWTRKVAATDQPFSFMRTIEWEMPYWNLGHTFDYAEMSYLMFPRPFMVERGHHDLVGRDHWVAHEFAKVRRLYAQFGKADQVEIEYFQGGHSINGERSFDFLHEHLNWPKP